MAKKSKKNIHEKSKTQEKKQGESATSPQNALSVITSEEVEEHMQQQYLHSLNKEQVKRETRQGQSSLKSPSESQHLSEIAEDQDENNKSSTSSNSEEANGSPRRQGKKIVKKNDRRSRRKLKNMKMKLIKQWQIYQKNKRQIKQIRKQTSICNLKKEQLRSEISELQINKRYNDDKIKDQKMQMDNLININYYLNNQNQLLSKMIKEKSIMLRDLQRLQSPPQHFRSSQSQDTEAIRATLDSRGVTMILDSRDLMDGLEQLEDNGDNERNKIPYLSP